MWSILENTKNFKIIKLSREEAYKLGWGVRKSFLCMHCNEDIKEDLYYIAVLNDVMCKDCFEDWYEGTKNYSEDRKYELINFNHYYNLLSNLK